MLESISTANRRSNTFTDNYSSISPSLHLKLLNRFSASLERPAIIRFMVIVSSSPKPCFIVVSHASRSYASCVVDVVLWRACGENEIAYGSLLMSMSILPLSLIRHVSI